MYFTAYIISPTFCHRLVGYLEERAVHTYSQLLKDMDDGKFPEWKNSPCPPEAIEYYDLKPDATFYDLVLNVRADEACHRELNHHFGDIKFYEDVDHLHVEVCDKNEKTTVENQNKTDSKPPSE